MISKLFLSFIVLCCTAGCSSQHVRNTDPSNVKNSVHNQAVTLDLPKGSIVDVIAVQRGLTKITHRSIEGVKTRGQVRTDRLKPLSYDSRGKYAAIDAYDCADSYHPKTEACVALSDVSLRCLKKSDGKHYRHCIVDLNYDLSTNHQGSAPLDVGVECAADLVFQRSKNASWIPDIRTSDKYYGLPVSGNGADGMSIVFPFSKNDFTSNVKIVSAMCRIDSIN